MKNIIPKIIHYFFGLMVIVLVFFIPYMTVISFKKAGIYSWQNFSSNLNNPVLIFYLVSGFIFWLIMIHLSFRFFKSLKKE